MQHALEQLKVQQQALIAKHPKIAPFFVDIEVRKGLALPFLPIGTFRKFHVFQKDEAHRSFVSSGSTNEVRAKHSFTHEGIETYSQNTSRNFRSFLTSFNIPLDAPILSLVPTTKEWPESSLAAMIEMFKNDGLNVIYTQADIQSSCDHVVVFGTSFHHLLASQQANLEVIDEAFRGKHVTVIDTGGTKGRTRNLTLNEVHDVIRSTYKSAASCQIVSEYGMCELSSQAWSLNTPHDGWFKTNDTLKPVLIDLDKRSIIHQGNRPGFLAFIDEVNQDSYMAIITEDIAVMTLGKPGCFKLIGRAPDASVKGCSLNVKANFQSTVTKLSAKQLRTQFPRSNEERHMLGVVISLPESVWERSAKSDLMMASMSIGESKTKIKQTRVDQRVLMILSANIPITFFYPAFMFRARGVKELHIKLPSIRPDDPFSARVRKQISSLLERMSPFFYPMTIYLDTSEDISLSSLKDFDTVLVFGSDDTVNTFRAALPEEGRTKLIGLGSVLNAHVLKPKDKPGHLAFDFARWLGRGCLTPVAMVGNDPFEGFLEKFEKDFEERYAERLEETGLGQPFAHRHLLLEVESILQTLGRQPSDHIHRRRNTCVIDLRELDLKDFVQSEFPFSKAGSGLIFVISQAHFDAMGNLKNYPTNPKFSDPHMDKTWDKWIS